MNLREYLMATHPDSNLLAEADRQTFEWAKPVEGVAEGLITTPRVISTVVNTLPDPRLCPHTLLQHEQMGWTCDGVAVDQLPPAPRLPKKYQRPTASVQKGRERMRITRRRARILNIKEWHNPHYCRKVNEAWAALPPDTREAYEATFAAGGAR